MYRKKRHIHFVGIGGIGMSGIAEVLLNLGHTITGSDLAQGNQTRRLKELGAQIHFGHKASQVMGADVVVVSSAINEDNPELTEAKRLRVPVIPRAEMLSELMRLKTGIAVAGSHGKTSTCSLIGTILTLGGMDPTLVIGGKINNLGLNARLGQGEYLVAEADESDGSFLLLSPTIAVVTNIDREHMNYYRDLGHLKESFLSFINKVPFYGLSILCLDDPEVQSLIPKVKKRYVTYGFSAQAMVTAKNLEKEAWGYSFDLYLLGNKVTRLTLNIPGRHNVLNTLAAAAVSLEMGISTSDLERGVYKLTGVGRRFEKKGEAQGIVVLDDYGHHPTEIKATLSALAETYPEQRRLVIFQPHRHTRTKDLFREFVSSFNQADKLWVTKIYSAGETPSEGIDAIALTEAIREHGHSGAYYGGEVSEVPYKVIEAIEPGDVILTLGAGNVWEASEEILRLWQEKNNAL
ncbi:MAG: UDP-N-acetylmuramate--L-alanine ligase [Deltaproteobacteria bacterium]|jgi:UDP-N-acetylmuramate--alanine ligase|nr:UDP-N-acetylmuramate--L-alanine ligase [Deltaproteobacteria bacterium]